MEKRIWHLIVIRVWMTFFISGAITVQATDHYVTPAGGYGTNNPPYTNWADAATNIQWAVDAASVDDTVWVTNGTYYLTNQITITNKITVRSVNGYSNTLVAADWPNYTNLKCFYVARTGTVDGFTISNGHHSISNNNDGGGGAFITTNGIVQNCYFVNNVCSNSGTYTGGGGACIRNGGIISNCQFVANTCYRTGGSLGYGGGAFVNINGTILNCSFISNNAAGAGAGGGVYLYGTDYRYQIASNCFIAFNSAGGGGRNILRRR